MFKQLPSNVWNHSLYPPDFIDVIFEFARSIFALRNVDFESLECQLFFTRHVILSFDLSILHAPNAHLLLYIAWTTTVLRIEFEGFILSLILWKSAPAKAFLTILQLFGCVTKDTQFAQLDICFSICVFVLSNLKNHYLCLLCIKFHMSCFHICWCIFAISWLNLQTIAHLSRGFWSMRLWHLYSKYCFFGCQKCSFKPWLFWRATCKFCCMQNSIWWCTKCCRKSLYCLVGGVYLNFTVV